MRRRLTIAILAVVVGTLVLTVAGGLFLVRRAAITTAETEITQEAQTVGQLITAPALAAETGARALAIMRALKVVGRYDYLRPVGLSPSGTFEVLPAPLTQSVMDPAALLDDQTVAGNVGGEVFVAVPIALTPRQRSALGGIATGDLPVLVATRHVQDPVNGVGYFLIVAGVVLIVGVVVATVVARRVSTPLVRAVDTTRRIAAGDLSAKVPKSTRDYPELAELADAINSMGDSLSRSRGLERQFLLSVSHELRTPLTSIRGYAEAVTEGATDDVTGALAIIGGEAQRLQRLVDDLLDLARLDARHFSLHVLPTDAAAVAAGVADGFRPQAHDLGLELLTFVPPAGGSWVDADPDRLGQIVANLVENAFKFASTRVVVGVGPAPAANTPGGSVPSGYTAIWVMDDGPGIAPEDLGRVFERHFTSDRRPRRTLGSGLGLAIVAELAAAMGATVAAQSPASDGGGTRMVAWFPSGRAPDPPGPPPATA